ncbi:MAG TPA: type IV pilin protein [Burkholderiales bacterium]
MQRNQGFSLIELMIVILVIGILASVAWPSYTNYVIRANRSVAQQFMMQVAQRQEQFMLDQRAYAATLAQLNMAVPVEASGRYTFAMALDAGPPPAFTITATATGRQASDGNLTLNSLGQKTPAEKWVK